MTRMVEIALLLVMIFTLFMFVLFIYNNVIDSKIPELVYGLENELGEVEEALDLTDELIETVSKYNYRYRINGKIATELEKEKEIYEVIRIDRKNKIIYLKEKIIIEENI